MMFVVDSPALSASDLTLHMRFRRACLLRAVRNLLRFRWADPLCLWLSRFVVIECRVDNSDQWRRLGDMRRTVEGVLTNA